VSEIIVKITHKQETKSFPCRKGLGLIALALKQETAMQFDCKAADCGICIIKVLEGAENLSEPTKEEADFLKAMNADESERLACQVNVNGNVSIEVEF